MSGDLRLIPLIISVINQGKYFLVTILIKRDILVEDCTALDVVVEGAVSSAPVVLVFPAGEYQVVPLAYAPCPNSLIQTLNFEFGRRNNLRESHEIRKIAMPCPFLMAITTKVVWILVRGREVISPFLD